MMKPDSGSTASEKGAILDTLNGTSGQAIEEVLRFSDESGGYNRAYFTIWLPPQFVEIDSIELYLYHEETDGDSTEFALAYDAWNVGDEIINSVPSATNTLGWRMGTTANTLERIKLGEPQSWSPSPNSLLLIQIVREDPASEAEDADIYLVGFNLIWH
jgi:hypothetical protein